MAKHSTAQSRRTPVEPEYIRLYVIMTQALMGQREANPMTQKEADSHFVQLRQHIQEQFVRDLFGEDVVDGTRFLIYSPDGLRAACKALIDRDGRDA